MGKQTSKEKPKEVVFVSLGPVSYMHKDLQTYNEGVFVDKEDSTNNWRYKYMSLSIVEEVDGKEIVRNDDYAICIFDTSEWGKKNGMPQK